MAGNSLGRFIRESRESLRLTSRKVEELSRSRPGLVPLSHSNLLAIEKGAHIPTFDKILTLAAILNIPTRHFEERLQQDMAVEPAAGEDDAAPESLLQGGKAALAEGRDGRALELFTQAYAAASRAAELGSSPALAEFQAEARLQAANCHVRMGLLRIAKDELEELLGSDSIAPRMAVRASFLLAEIHRKLGNGRLALLHGKSALEHATAEGDPALRAKILNTVGNILDDRGDTAAAADYFRDALRAFEACGDRRNAGLVARNLGKAHARLGDLDAAQRAFLDGLAAAREVADRRGQSFAFANLAQLYYLKGDSARSKEHARQAKQIAQLENYVDLLFISLYYLWKAAVRENEPSLARVYAERLGVLQRKMETRCPELDEWLAHLASTRRVRS